QQTGKQAGSQQEQQQRAKQAAALDGLSNSTSLVPPKLDIPDANLNLEPATPAQSQEANSTEPLQQPQLQLFTTNSGRQLWRAPTMVEPQRSQSQSQSQSHQFGAESPPVAFSPPPQRASAPPQSSTQALPSTPFNGPTDKSAAAVGKGAAATPPPSQNGVMAT
ncbi:hypothetical protein Vafri_3883, partial [Volvox africanus]